MHTWDPLNNEISFFQNIIKGSFLIYFDPSRGTFAWGTSDKERLANPVEQSKTYRVGWIIFFAISQSNNFNRYKKQFAKIISYIQHLVGSWNRTKEDASKVRDNYQLSQMNWKIVYSPLGINFHKMIVL